MRENSISDNSVKIGASVGLAAGAGAGVVKGMKKAKAILAPYTPAMNVGEVGSDAFIKEQTDYVTNGIKALQDKGKEITPKVQYKLKYGFQRMVEHFPNVKKLVKNTKIKSIALMALAGTAIGAGIAFVVNKIKALKAQKAE